MQKKKGVSLIVLVITIIVMIILASVIVIQLDNSDIIDNANDAVDATNLQEVQELANLKWSEAYMEGIKTKLALEKRVLTGLRESGIDVSEYKITVTTKGVKVEYLLPKLEAPTISVNSSKTVLTIVPASSTEGKVEGYTIYVNGEAKTTITELTFNLGMLDLVYGSYNITVRANSNSKEYSASEDSNAIAYGVALSAPTISVSGDILTIVPNPKNVGVVETYKISRETGTHNEIGEANYELVATTTETTFDLSTLSWVFEHHSFYVETYVDGKSIATSSLLYYKAYQLYAPTISGSGNNATIKITDNAQNGNNTEEYVICKSGQEMFTIRKTSEAMTLYLPDYKDIIGSYAWVSVKARSSEFKDSEQSNKLEYYTYIPLD